MITPEKNQEKDSASLLERLSNLPDTSVSWNLFLLLTGSLLCAWAVNAILVPHQFLSGGMTGLSLILHYLFPSWDVGILYFLLNIPLFALGWMQVGKRFFLYSIAGLCLYSGVVLYVKGTCPLDDRILAALLAGIIYGVGSGLILRSKGSAGGTDILSIMILRKFSIRIGSTVLFFNVVVLVGSAFIFTLEAVLHTLIFMYVSAKMVDLVVTGLSQRKAVLIISDQWEAIQEVIIHEIKRGVTLVPAQGGFTGKSENMIYTVVSFRELSRLKERIRQIDPNPFVVVYETLEVIGHRIGNQPQW